MKGPLMTYDEAVEQLSVDFPEMSKQALREYVEGFVDGHIENLVEYTDYNEEYAELIERGVLPEDKHTLLLEESGEKYLELWDLDDIAEYIEDEEEVERAIHALEQPKSPLGRLWAYIKACCRSY
jgi:hypothetical protein